MKTNIRRNIFLLFFILFSFAIFSSAHASTGYIDTSVTDQAKVCHDSTCATPTPGIINFKLSNEPSIVIDSVTGISGRVWGNQLGWITMNPTGDGVRFADPTSGLLTGKAWSQVSGWINFAVTGQSVTIDPATGEFNGWAWTGGPYGGWIKFDCGNTSTCVKTTWKADSGGSTTGGGKVGTPVGTTDVCLNIDGTQESIPAGYTINDVGQCVKIVDECPNLDGNQSTIPKGYKVNDLGACVTLSRDLCINLPEIQKEIPEGYVISDRGSCVKPADDMCANLLDIQASVPAGYYQESDNCFHLPKSPDTVPPPWSGNGGSGGPSNTGIKPVDTIVNSVVHFSQSIMDNILRFTVFFSSFIINSHIWLVHFIENVVFSFLNFFHSLFSKIF